MKKNAGIVLAMILYAFLAIGIVFVIYRWDVSGGSRCDEPCI